MHVCLNLAKYVLRNKKISNKNTLTFGVNYRNAQSDHSENGNL